MLIATVAASLVDERKEFFWHRKQTFKRVLTAVMGHSSRDGVFRTVLLSVPCTFAKVSTIVFHNSFS